MSFCILAACEASLSTAPPLVTGDDAGAGKDSGGTKTDSATGGDDGAVGGDDSGGNTVDSGPAGDSGHVSGGCAGGTCLNPNCVALGTPEDPGSSPQIGFEPQPSYIPNDVIIPTFDDVPDGVSSPPDPLYGAGSWTKLDLEFFATNNMHVDFFINTNNWCGDVTQDSECTNDIMQILALHNPANHTVYHPHMGTASTTTPPAGPDGCTDATSCESELSGVETVINTLSGGARPHLTRFRAPYGEPFQTPTAALTAYVEPTVAKYAVEVGWNIDSGDASGGAFTGQQIAAKIESLIGSRLPGSDAGSPGWGIVLQHGTNPWTHDSLPLLYGPNGYMAKNGFKIGTVEDVICWKFGKHSWEIVQQVNPGQTRAPN